MQNFCAKKGKCALSLICSTGCLLSLDSQEQFSNFRGSVLCLCLVIGLSGEQSRK